MAQPNHTPRLLGTEEALSVLFCLVDDAYAHLNPRARSYESLKRLADSELITLALFQQLRGGAITAWASQPGLAPPSPGGIS